MVKVNVQLPVVLQAVLVEVPAITAPVAVSNNLTSSAATLFALKVEEEAALPVMVTMTVFNETDPAFEAAKVKVPISSMVFLALLEAEPRAAAVTVKLLRTIVWVFPVGLDKVMVAAELEEFPSAVTIVEVVANSVEVPIKKVLVVLSVAPPETKDATSPFKVKVFEPDFGITTGVAKWKL